MEKKVGIQSFQTLTTLLHCFKRVFSNIDNFTSLFQKSSLLDCKFK
jgi:hypothetical protein